MAVAAGFGAAGAGAVLCGSPTSLPQAAKANASGALAITIKNRTERRAAHFFAPFATMWNVVARH